MTRYIDLNIKKSNNAIELMTENLLLNTNIPHVDLNKKPAETKAYKERSSFANMSPEQREYIISHLKELREAMDVCEKRIRESTIKYYSGLINVQRF